MIYPTTKGAIIQMTRAMAAHHGQENIRVNCVAPGMVYTPMTRGRGMTDEMRQARINQNLMKKEGTGWDVGYGMEPLDSPPVVGALLTCFFKRSCSLRVRKLAGLLA